MRHTKHLFIAFSIALAASAAAFAQEASEPEKEKRGNPIAAAQEALGLSSEQRDQIREILRQRPPRQQSREEAAEWRENRREQVTGVLNEDQRAKLAELERARAQMGAVVGAAMLGLTEAPRPGNWGARGRANRGGQAFRGRRGPSPGYGGRGRRGPGQGAGWGARSFRGGQHRSFQGRGRGPNPHDRGRRRP